MKVLCIVNAKDAPAIINILQPIRLLKKRGLLSYSVLVEDRLGSGSVIKDLSTHDIIVFFRTTSPAFLKYVYYAKLLGKKIIYGVDDNFFDLNLSEQEPLQPLILNAHARYIEKSDAIIVYSELMAERLGQFNPNIWRITPGIDFSLLKGLKRRANDNKKLKIVYATSRFQRDILSNIFSPALKKILKEYENRIEMHFWGFMPNEFKSAPYVKCKKYVRYEEYLREFYKEGFDVGLAPMHDDEFHGSKTNTKLRDYGACGVAGIYSRVGIYSGCVDGETGILVDNTEESWYLALRRLIEDKELRDSIKIKAEEYVKKNYDMERVASELYRLLLSVAKTPIKIMPAKGFLSYKFLYNFIDIKYPRISYAGPPSGEKYLEQIRSYYGYPYKFIEFDKIKLNKYLVPGRILIVGGVNERIHAKEAIASNGKVITLDEISEISSGKLVNKIEDVFYFEILNEIKIYRYSGKIFYSPFLKLRNYLKHYIFSKPALHFVIKFYRFIKRLLRKR